MPGARDTYRIAADSTSFSYTATANLGDDATVDTWSINQEGY
ncbi:MAG: hypothetical protein WBD28_07490 [Candidatus Zixiibacteriota bacterium]